MAIECIFEVAHMAELETQRLQNSYINMIKELKKPCLKN